MLTKILLLTFIFFNFDSIDLKSCSIRAITTKTTQQLIASTENSTSKILVSKSSVDNDLKYPGGNELMNISTDFPYYSEVPKQRFCQSGWTLYNGDYYCYNQISLNNADASSWCASNGATLINIHNQQDLSFALSLANHGASFWVNINILN